MSRRFYLHNSLGEEVALNGESGIRFINPQGLGYSLSPTYADLKYGFYRQTSDESEPQGEVVGDIAFTGAVPYQDYKSFVDWINKGYPLELIYEPNMMKYYRPVKVITLQKGELERAGYLLCPATFSCLSPWYKASPISMRIEPTGGSGSTTRYDCRYPARYQQSRLESSVEVEAGGHMPSAVRVTVTGPLINPAIALRDEATNELYGKMQLNTTLYSGDTLFFSTVISEAVVEINGKDASEYLELSNKSFFRIPLKRRFLLSIIADTSVTSTAFVQIFDYFRSA